MENHNQTLREQKWKDTRVRRQVEISEIDRRLAKLQEALQELCDQYESE